MIKSRAQTMITKEIARKYIINEYLLPLSADHFLFPSRLACFFFCFILKFLLHR